MNEINNELITAVACAGGLFCMIIVPFLAMLSAQRNMKGKK